MAGAGDQAARVADGMPEVPGYRIERQIGRGSMGTVYLAQDTKLRRKVALKVLTPALADDELFGKRFDRESRSAATLDHPNIVPVYAAGEAGGLLYIAMRYVPGGDLRSLLADVGPLDLEVTTAIIGGVADALDSAHEQGMIHRDIKPANVLVDDLNGRQHYYLSDFGIAKMISSGRSLTSAGQIVGTIDYIAPEQIQGRQVDGRADLYALGCVLYQCLTDEVPFHRDDTAALMWAHVSDDPPSAIGRRPELPAGLDRIVAKALAKEPAERYQTGRDLVADLRAVAADPDAPLTADRAGIAPAGPAALATAGQATPAAPVSPADSAPEVDGTTTYTPPAALLAATPETGPPPPRQQRRKLLLAAAGAATFALLAGLATAGVGYLSSRYPNDAEESLLRDVPLALQASCTRNDAIIEGSANVDASLVCTPSGGDVNSFVFTKFSSPSALDGNYRAAVTTAGVSDGSGDCRSGDRAETDYHSDSEAAHGRVLCFQRRGSSFLTWTDEKSQTLGVAVRHDPDNEKLRDWWAGVNDVKLPETDPAATASPPPAPVPAAVVSTPPAFDPGVFGPEMSMSAFSSDSGDEDSSDEGSSDDGDSGGGDGGLGGSSDSGSSDEGSSDEGAKEGRSENVPSGLVADNPAPAPAAVEPGKPAEQKPAEQKPAAQDEKKQNEKKQDDQERKKRDQDARKSIEDSWIEKIKANPTLRREAEKRCNGADKDKDGRIKDDELRGQCAKFDDKYKK